MLPLSTPAIATIALFIGVGNWNDWFTGAIYVSRRRDLFTAATLLRDIIASASFESSMDDASGLMQFNQSMTAMTTTPESLKMAFLVILTLPIMCVYPFLQKYFVKGVMIGSIKE
jgi:putative aldouronate transport system permease protein